MSFSFSKLGVSFGAVLKKSKKRQAKTPLLKIRSTPIALAALPAVFLLLGSSPTSRPRFLPYVIFVLKTCISFVAVPKKSKKRQAKTPLLQIRSTPIALAALPADFSIFSVPPLCQLSFEKPTIF